MIEIVLVPVDEVEVGAEFAYGPSQVGVATKVWEPVV
jgi:hypothetical protein